jgi:hypothetical protein
MIIGAGMDDGAAAASMLFGEAVAWLRDCYGQFEFWTERDLVWTVPEPVKPDETSGCLGGLW